MLKLIKCEFLKLKRKKFIPLIILAAFLFPIPLTYLMTTPSMMERYTDRADAFDGLFNMVLGYGIQFLLPCIIGVIAAILFFMERDNDTFKNLRTIPVTSTQMVLAKIIVLFIFGIVFCVASTIATILCGIGTLEVYGIGYKLFLAVETGIFITAGTLPLIVLVVFFSKTYVFSILLCVFYSVLNMSATALFDTGTETIFHSKGNFCILIYLLSKAAALLIMCSGFHFFLRFFHIKLRILQIPPDLFFGNLPFYFPRIPNNQ